MNFDMDASERFRTNVRQELAKQHVTVSELSRRVGCAQPTMSAVLNGRENVTLDRAERIAKALSLPLTELLVETLQHA